MGLGQQAGGLGEHRGDGGMAGSGHEDFDGPVGEESRRGQAEGRGFAASAVGAEHQWSARTPPGGLEDGGDGAFLVRGAQLMHWCPRVGGGHRRLWQGLTEAQERDTRGLAEYPDQASDGEVGSCGASAPAWVRLG